MKQVTGRLCQRIKSELKTFHFLGIDDPMKLEPYLECRRLQVGETLWEEDGECGFMVFVVTGCLMVKKQTEFEGKNVIVGLYGPGAIAGELCILDASPRVVTANAHEDSEILVLTRENFERLCKESPELAVKLLKGMLLAVSTRLRKSFDRLASVF